LALQTAGGSVVSIGDTNLIKLGWGETIAILLGKSIRYNQPHQMINPSMNPGDCFGFQGSKGTATIKLMGKVIKLGSVEIGL
jgi:hypothetical protein